MSTSTNRRTFYATQAAGLAPFDMTVPSGQSSAYTAIRGLQSVGVNTKFNLEQIFEIGQLAIYENIENIPDIEITAEKVLDGYPLIFHLGTYGATTGTLVGRSNQRAHFALSVFDDTKTIASGTPLKQLFCSGVYVSQVEYAIQVQGAATESCTFVGNNKVWSTGNFTFNGFAATHGVTDTTPYAPEGVNMRQDMIMANCRWPAVIPGINASGVNPLASGGLNYEVCMQSVRSSVNLGREQLFELGRRGPYFRYIQFPVEVTTTIEVLAKEGDLISATEDGILGAGSNQVEDQIKIVMEEGLILDLGTKNLMASVNYGGANAGTGGGNATATYTFTTYNDFTVKHLQDPTVALRSSAGEYE